MGGAWKLGAKSQPLQPGDEYGHDRQRQKDIHDEGNVDAGQQVGTEGHHGTEDRDADGNRNPLACGHQAGGEPCISIPDL